MNGALLPLAGTRVVDTSVNLAGSLCGRLLADAGAEVTKLESAPNKPVSALGAQADWLEFVNLGKKRVEADLDNGDGRAVLERLLDDADLYLTSSRHDGELGCTAALAGHPQLTAACVTPFGQSGPYVSFVANEAVLCALCGLADATPGFPDHREQPDDAPVQSLAMLTELAGALIAANAVHGALLAAMRGRPKPRHVEVSTLEAAASLMVWEWGITTYGGGVRGRRPIPADLAPNCYLRCRDGHVVVVAFRDPHWHRLVGVMGSPEWALDPRFATATERAAHWPDLRTGLETWAAEQHGLDLLVAAQAEGIPCSCAFELTDTIASEQVEATGSVQRVGTRVFPADPIVVNGKRRAGGAPSSTHRAPIVPAKGSGGPLDGVRVLDLGQAAAGPFAGQTLAALGAEVIRVESRAHPISRGHGPFVGEPKYDAAAMFHQMNRGKSSVELNLKTDRGHELLLELVAESDVVLENLSRRAANKLRVTYENLTQARSDIILASISGFGRTGPWRDYVALHSGVILLSGLASVTRDEDGEMRLPGAIYPDLLTGLYLALAIQQAVAARGQTGTGCHLEVSMLDVLLTSMGGLVPSAARGATFGASAVQFAPSAEPARFVAISDGSPGAAKFAANHTRQEAMVQLQADGISAASVLDITEVIADPHLAARGFVLTGDHPIAGPRPMPAVPWLNDGVRPTLAHAPLLGDATERVIASLGEDRANEIELLRREGVLR